jgi:hypothetical protein
MQDTVCLPTMMVMMMMMMGSSAMIDLYARKNRFRYANIFDFLTVESGVFIVDMFLVLLLLC